ncbi:MAG: flagellar filament capping protein FliD [Mycobacteriaceae bacterium]|nr:flagellar filament capping protein FliD [Mycobacteriaceae bacterium]
MSGITTGVGAFSGINSGQIIDQLLTLASRPKTTAQARIASIQKIQAAYLDVTSKTTALRTIAQGFRLNRIFQTAKASSATESVVTASASTGAPSGQYSVTVARLASSQQNLSRGFADSTVSGLGVSQVVVEDARGRMDTDTPLNQLNGGNGVQRGRLIVTDSAGTRTTVDLTRASTLNDVITAFNDAGAGRFRIAVSSSGTGLTVTDSAGGPGAITVAGEGSVTTAQDLGINAAGAGSIVGSRINALGRATRLSSLNDGLGVFISNTGGTGRRDFEIKDRAGVTHAINIGDVYGGPSGERTAVAATTLGDVIDRINAQSGGAITARIATVGPNAGSALELVDNTGQTLNPLTVTEVGAGSTAVDLGIIGAVAAPVSTGTLLISKLNSVSMTRLLGGTTIAPGTFTLKTRDGTTIPNIAFTAADATGSVTDFIASFNSRTAGKATLSTDPTGTRFILTDNTTGSYDFSLSGTPADALGLQQDPTASGTITGARTQRQWIGRSTALADLNGRRGIGEGRISITTAAGAAVEVNITSSQRTVGELIDQINYALGTTTDTRARVNDTGDGLLIESTNPAAPTAVSIRDVSGSVARSLNLNTTSTGAGAANRVDGSYERVITVDPSDTMTEVSDAINAAGVGLLASVINDGSANPFRLSVTSRNSGTAGAVTIDTGAADIGLRTISQARNALVFYGSDDPTRALAIESNSNSVTNAIPGVTLNLVSASATPTSVSVTADNDSIVKEVKKFVDAFNALLNSIDSRSKYDSGSNTRGVLLGDTTAQELRRTALDLVQTPGQGVNSTFRFLFDVGVQLNGDGNLELKEDKLRAAIEADPQGVADLFAGRVQAANNTTRDIRDPNNPNVVIARVVENVAGAITTRGILEIFADRLESYTRSTDGVFARRGSVLDQQIKTQNGAIDNLNKRLANRRTILQNQFAAMESAIARLQSQSGSVSSISSLSLR